MYYYLIKQLKQNNYSHYEISNFAHEGCLSKHNLNYWKSGKYIGIGAGAHSYIYNERYNNIAQVESYISKIMKDQDIVENRQSLSDDDKIFEFIMLRLRLIDGFLLNEFFDEFNIDFVSKYNKVIDKLISRGLIYVNDRIRLTNVGLDLANQVFIEFID
jgi:oxygen-independent coproporphyrinogen-3 oxidase